MPYRKLAALGEVPLSVRIEAARIRDIGGKPFYTLNSRGQVCVVDLDALEKRAASTCKEDKP
jgi:hypothetical protein